MPVSFSSTSHNPGPAVPNAVDLGEERRAWLREATLAGPVTVPARAWEETERGALLGRLVAPGDIERALAEAGYADGRKRALPGASTASVVLALALYSGEGYGSVLAKMAPHLRGGTLMPGNVPSASALSQSRARLGERPMYRLFLRQA